MDEQDKIEQGSQLDKRLGTPIKKKDGLSSDLKKAESEHLHAFRDDVNVHDTKEDK